MALWYIGHGFEKYSNYLTGLGLIFWYIRLEKCYYYSYWTYFDMGCGLIKLINQAELSLEKYEDALEWSVKQYVMQLSPTSLGQIMCDLWKMFMMLVTKLVIFCIKLDLCLSKSNPIQF